MSEQEMRDFIMEGTRTAHIATVRKDGRPHVAPIWIVMDGDDILFTSFYTTVKMLNLQRQSYAALSIDEPSSPYSFVVVEGTVRFDPDPEASRYWAGVLGGRYMGADRVDEFGRRNGIEGEWVCRLNPSKWTGIRNIAE
jgi:PPOX class probable F420-dependent enzyme